MQLLRPQASARVDVEDVAAPVLLQRVAYVAEDVVCQSRPSASSSCHPRTADPPGLDVPHRRGLTSCVRTLALAGIVEREMGAPAFLAFLVGSSTGWIVSLSASVSGYSLLVFSFSAVQCGAGPLPLLDPPSRTAIARLRCVQQPAGLSARAARRDSDGRRRYMGVECGGKSRTSPTS